MVRFLLYLMSHLPSSFLFIYEFLKDWRTYLKWSCIKSLIESNILLEMQMVFNDSTMNNHLSNTRN